VNTIIVKGKKKAARGKAYTRSDIKKAIVTLEEGHQIDITTGL
jgi:large subunit ribosomal protein L23